MADEARRIGVRVVVHSPPPQVRVFGGDLSRLTAARNLWTGIRYATPYNYAFARFLRCERADLLVCNTHRSALLLSLQRRIGSVPVVGYLRGEGGKMTGVGRALVRFSCDGMIAVNRRVADLYRMGARGCIIPNGIPSTFGSSGLSDAREKRWHRARLGQGPIIIAVGSILPFKGLDDLLTAFEIVHRSCPNAELRMVGHLDLDPGFTGRLQRRIQDAGLDQHAQLVGFSDDVASLLLGADIAVSASHEEGAPRAVLEELACELPIVATDVGGTRELLEGSTATVVQPHDPEGLAHELITMIKAWQRHPALGKENRGHVLANFSDAVMHDRFVSCTSRWL